MRAIMMLASLAAVLAATTAQAGAGLKTQFGEVVIKGLKIGQTYSLLKLVNLPLRLVNTGDGEVEVVISPLPPSEAVLREGYAPIPSVDWVSVERSTLTIGPNREGATDVLIAVPNDPSLLGKRVQVGLWSRTRDPNSPIAVAILSHLLIHIDSEPPTEDELKKNFVDETLANLDFTVMPTSVDLGSLAAGERHDLRKTRKVALKLVNPNDRALNFRVKALPVWESLILPPPGTLAAHDAGWLKPAREVVEVEANSIVEVPMTLEIADEPRNRGKRFMLLLSVEALEQKIPTKVYSKYFVTVPDSK